MTSDVPHTTPWLDSQMDVRVTMDCMPVSDIPGGLLWYALS